MTNQPAPSDTPNEDINTPRTNNFCNQLRVQGVDWHHSATLVARYARQLERELTGTSAEREKEIVDLKQRLWETSGKLGMIESELVERDKQLAEANAQLEADKFKREEWSNIIKKWAEMCDQLATSERQRKEMEGQYNELIMAVGRRCEGESRHQTALKYIMMAESLIMIGEPQSLRSTPETKP